jgi:hypothetical protein
MSDNRPMRYLGSNGRLAKADGDSDKGQQFLPTCLVYVICPVLLGISVPTPTSLGHGDPGHPRRFKPDRPQPSC